MKGLIGCMMAVVAGAAFAAVTETVDGRVVTLSGNGTWTKVISSNDVDSVVLAAGSTVHLLPDAPSTYTGGTTASGSLAYAETDDAFGLGDFTLASGALAVSEGRYVTVPNKVVFAVSGMYNYASSMDYNSCLTLKSVGTPSGASTHNIRLGRPSANDEGAVALSLTDEGSEALDQITLSGNLHLYIDGGVLKMRSTAKNPFFTHAYPGSSIETVVMPGGIGVDVPSGVMTSLGEPLTFTNSTEAVQEVFYPENYSFENGTTGWTLTTLHETSSWCQNGGSFDDNGRFPTTNGTHYVMVRRGNAIKTTIRLPTAGDWRVVFERGCRNETYSLGMAVQVMTNDVAVAVFPRLTAVERFTLLKTAAIAFDANRDYELSILVEDIASGNCSLNFDAIRLERVETVPVAAPPPVVKKGDGTLALGMQPLDGTAVTAEGGILSSSVPSLGNVSISVLNGGTYMLADSAPTPDTTISVASGGTLSIVGMPGNLVKNGNFEADVTSNYMTKLIPGGWSAERFDPDLKSKTADGCSVQRNASGTTLVPQAPLSPYGNTSAYLRPLNKMYQTISVPQAGDYVLSFVEATRKNYEGYKEQIDVLVDGAVVYTIPARQSPETEFVRYTTTLTLSAGDHVLAIATGDTPADANGALVFFDDITLRPADAEVVVDGTLALSSGATLSLDNSVPLRWVDVTVDGVRVNGGKNALVAAGVNVCGAGKLRVGDKPGFIVIVR